MVKKEQAIHDFCYCEIIPTGKTFKVAFKLVRNLLQLKFHFDIPMDWFCCLRGQLWLIALLDVLLARFPFFACIRLVFANTRQVSLSNNVLNHCEIVRLFLFFFLFIKGYLEYFPSRRLFVHNQQCENKTRPIWRLLKVKNKDTRTASMTSLWCLYY